MTWIDELPEADQLAYYRNRTHRLMELYESSQRALQVHCRREQALEGRCVKAEKAVKNLARYVQERNNELAREFRLDERAEEAKDTPQLTDADAAH